MLRRQGVSRGGPGGVGAALPHLGVARSDRFASHLLHQAGPAGAERFHSIGVAERGNGAPNGLHGLQNGRSARDVNGSAIDGRGYMPVLLAHKRILCGYLPVYYVS